MLGLKYAGGFAAQLFRRATYSDFRAARTTANIAAAPKQNQGTAAATTSTTGSSTTATTTAASDGAASAEATDTKKPKSALVAAAFESLNDDSAPAPEGNKHAATEATKFNSSNIDERIVNANTVNGLLSVSETNGTISRRHALKIVSILAEWSSMKRVKISDFENDTRFQRICRVLGRTVPKNGGGGNAGSNGDSSAAGLNGQKRISGFRTDDLNTVLGVAGDDEAAKLIASISVPQMVKVMSTLAQRKRRSTPLLRSLAFNISSTTESLDLKQCADVLYAMATLNFQDSVLAAKICAEIQGGLAANTDKSAVVGSILTSLGILKYRDLDILESLTNWTLHNSEICRPQDLSALFLTSSMLNFKSENMPELRQKLVGSIVAEDFTKPIDWLNHVWALAMLGLVENKQLATVLSSEFVAAMQADKFGLSPTSRMKLLNLNAYAQLLAKQYDGALLPADSVVYDVPMAHAKSKQMLLNGMLDALKSLLPSSNHVQSLKDSKMGFLIDALCLFDAKRNPLPCDKEHPNAIKVALMVVDFHDVCHGTDRAASGITNLSFDLLEKSGYKVVPVPYNEFNTSDKLLKRVQYLEGKFKTIISNKN